MFYQFSTPEQLQSDQNCHFESDLIAKEDRILKKTRTTPYHPQGDGALTADMLDTAMKEQPGEWDSHIQRVCLTYNSCIQSTTDYTAFF